MRRIFFFTDPKRRPKPKARKKRRVRFCSNGLISYRQPVRKETKDRQRRFLQAFAQCGTLSDAAAAIGMRGHMSHFRWLKLSDRYPYYREWYAQAKQKLNDRITKTIQNRGIDGWKEPVFYKGNVCGYVRRFSDQLLLAEARRRMPEYRERYQVDGAGSQHLHLHQNGGEKVVVYIPDNGREAPGLKSSQRLIESTAERIEDGDQVQSKGSGEGAKAVAGSNERGAVVAADASLA